jgi:hypothetical protein
VNTWGGFEVERMTRSLSEMSVALIGFNKVAKREYMNPTQCSLARETFLNRVRKHREDTVTFSQLPFESYRTLFLLMNGGEQGVIK